MKEKKCKCLACNGRGYNIHYVSPAKITSAYEFAIASGSSAFNARALQFAWDIALPLKAVSAKQWDKSFLAALEYYKKRKGI